MQDSMNTEEAAMPWAWIKCVQDECKSTWPPRSSTKLPVELLPWLFVSDEKSARDTSTLKELGVTHVLSVNDMPPQTREYLVESLESAKITHKMVAGEDEEDYDMLELHWDECHEFISNARDQGGRIVVHCLAGINRSVLIACAAHMIFEHTPLLNVVRNARAKRGSVLWNKSFQQQLCMLAMKEGLLGPMPSGYSNEELPKATPIRPPPKTALDKLTF